MYKFAAASEHETLVFGAARSGYRLAELRQWIQFMRQQDIQRVCCLLPETQLRRYPNLLEIYQLEFEQVCWASIADFHFASPELLMQQILPFLAAADRSHQKVVVHCSGGIGRTGHVLVAWLMAGRGFSQAAAIAAVRKTGRNPYEAVIAAPFFGRNPWKAAAELNRLLAECDRFRNKP